MKLSKQISIALFGAGVLLLAACTPAATPNPTPLPTDTLPTETTAAQATPTAPEAAPSSVPAVKPTTVPVAETEDRIFVVDAPLSIARYRVDEEFFNGAVTNLGKTLGFFTAVGWTRDIEGEIRLSQTEAGGLAFESGVITVEISTLQSDDSRRDERIQERHLESLKFPFAEFVITTVEGFPTDYVEGEEVQLTLIGDLTIRDQTRQETFIATVRLEGDTLSGSAETEINMVDYGFDPPEITGFLKAQDPATIEFEFVASEN